MFKNILDLPQISGYSPMQNVELFYSIQYTVKSIDENEDTCSVRKMAIQIYETLDSNQLDWLHDIKDSYKELVGNQAARIVFAQDCIKYTHKLYELNKEISEKYSNLIEDLPF